MIVARGRGRRPEEALHALGLRAPRAEGAGDIVRDIGAAERDRRKADEHAARKQRHIGQPGADLDERDAQLALLVAQARHTRRDRRCDDRFDLEMRRPHAQIQIAHRRSVGRDDVNIDAERIGVQPERLLDALQSVERVERRLRVEHHPPLGVDRVSPMRKQFVDVLLLDAVPAELDLDRRQIADQTARRKADPDILDVEPCDAFGLLDRFAHRSLGRIHVGDITAPHALRLALAGAEHVELAALAAFGDQRGHFPRPDIERGNQAVGTGLGHRSPFRYRARDRAACSAWRLRTFSRPAARPFVRDCACRSAPCRARAGDAPRPVR